jgi:hypothetical protein
LGSSPAGSDELARADVAPVDWGAVDSAPVGALEPIGGGFPVDTDLLAAAPPDAGPAAAEGAVVVVAV